MYFGESVVDEYITEGWFKNIIDKIFLLIVEFTYIDYIKFKQSIQIKNTKRKRGLKINPPFSF